MSLMKRLNWSHSVPPIILVITLLLSSGCVQLLPGAPTQPTPGSPTIQTSPNTTPATQNISPADAGFTIPLGQGQTTPLPSIADVVARVKPSVVAINTKFTSFDIFNRPFTEEGAGSGWIIREDGVIVTNNHVVEDAEEITITLDDGRTFPVDMGKIATDELTDLAIIRIDTRNLPAAAVGDSRKLRLGDWVVAIGNSLNLGVTPSAGIVRTLKATVPVSPGETLYDLLGTTAPINPGNSGGPLVNMAGEVIGITSAKISEAGVEGMGYAISSYSAKPIIEALIQKGFVVRPYLGLVSLYTVDQFAVARYNLAVDKGILIIAVAPGSPGEKAGLKARDVIVKFKDKDVTNVDEFLSALHSSQLGQEVTITYWRGRGSFTTSATLIESPPPSR